MDARITELEVHIAHQDKLIAELDEVVRAFATRVERLERQLDELRESVQHGAPDVGEHDETPPHY